MKTWKKIVRFLFLVVVIVPTVAAVAIQIPAVQTAIVGKATDILSRRIDGSVEVGKVYFSFPNNLILKDVCIIQGESDTLARAGKFLVNVSTGSLLFSKQAHIRRISLEDADLAIRKLPDGTTNLAALIAPLKREKDTPDGQEASTGLPWDRIRVSRITLKNINVSADSLDVRDLNLSLRDTRYDGSLATRIEWLTGTETVRDIRIERLEGQVALDSTGLQVRGLSFNDRNSDLQGDVSLAFSDFSDFSDFTRNVGIDANVRNTFIDLHSIQPLVKAQIPRLKLWIDGHVSGTVDDLLGEQIHVQTESGETAAGLRFHLRGLPDFERAWFDADIQQARTTTADLDALLASLSPDGKSPGIARYAASEPISLTAKATGPLSNLQFQGNVTTASMGAANLDGLLHWKKGALSLEGELESESLELGRIACIPSLGLFTGRTHLSLSSENGGTTAAIEPLSIDRLGFRGHVYHDIQATGSLVNGHVLAHITSNDPNLKMALQADADLGGKGQSNRYVIDLNLDRANLDILQLDERDSTSLSLAMKADIVQTPDGAFLGKADIQDMIATIGERALPIGDLSAESFCNDGRYGILLNASIAKAEYDGNVFITDFITDAVSLVMDDNLEHLFRKNAQHAERQDCSEHFGSLRLRTLDLQPLFDFFKPGLFLSQQTTLSLDLIDNEVQGGVSSELLAYGNHFLNNLQGRFFTMGNRIWADFDADRLQISSLTAENVTLDAFTDDDHIDLRLAFDNKERSDNRAMLHALVGFADPQQDGYLVRADIHPSDIIVAGHTWELAPATIQYRDKHIQITDFAIRSGTQSLSADGVAGNTAADTLRLRLHDFDIGLINAFTDTGLDLQGRLTGTGEGFALLGEGKGVLLDLEGRDMAAAGSPLGDLKLASRWDDPTRQFRILLDNTLEERHPIQAEASYRPRDKHLNLDTRFDRLNMVILEPLLHGLASEIGGSLSGHLKASGPIDKLSVESEGTRFNQLGFRLDYTQVVYTADGPFSVGNNGVTFDGIDITDKFGHHARLTGGVPFNHFKDISLNARIELHETQVLNTSLHDNSSFYGQAFANGQVRLSGPFDKIRLSLNLTTQPNTSVHIPLGNSAKQNTKLLTFINNEKEQMGMIDSMILAKQANKTRKSSSRTDLTVSLRLNTTPDAEILLEIDKDSDDILKARGNGQVSIAAGNSRDFEIKGDYRVDSGSYHFGMLGFTARDFSIEPGGTIGFNGEVMDTDLDLKATYRTIASINPLIADSTAVSTRRTVDCEILLSGKLANPEIGFNINIKDLDPTTQNRVESALNTEDKRMKQALALLVSGGFVPDEQSGIVNSSTMLYSNASEIMASQLNNIFRQLDIPIDLGFNYQPTEDGRNIFDVAVSTQLFNNRVSINGNIGNRQYYSSSNSDIVGDVDIEIKLNKQGQWRLTLFSHSADQYSNYLDLSQRNGAGIVYQEDFNSFKELWRKLFHIQTPNDEREPSLNPNAPQRPRPE